MPNALRLSGFVPHGGTVKLLTLGWANGVHESETGEGLGCSDEARDVYPDAERTCPGSMMLVGGDVVSAELKKVVDPVMGGKEALCLAR